MLEGPGPASHGLTTFSASRDPHAGWISAPLEHLSPHRMEYLEYQGPVSRGRGEVRRIATGSVHWVEAPSPGLAFELIDMEFLEPPFARWPTGRYCLTPQGDATGSLWHLTWRQESP